MTYGTDDDRLARLGDQQVHRARGGETHQRAGDGTGRLTTTQGVPVSDDWDQSMGDRLRDQDHGGY